jgi:hypothetical protein
LPCNIHVSDKLHIIWCTCRNRMQRPESASLLKLTQNRSKSLPQPNQFESWLFFWSRQRYVKYPYIFFSVDVMSGHKTWMYYSICTGLSKRRNGDEAHKICNMYFQNLVRRFEGWKAVDFVVCDVLFQKLWTFGHRKIHV